MTDATTPTGDSDQDSSGITNEPLLEETNTEQSTAVEESNDTDQSESSDSASDTSSATEESSDDNLDEDIAAFAKSQGYNVTDMSDTEKKLMRQLREQSVKGRKEAEKSKDFDKAIDGISSTTDAKDTDAKVALLEARLAAKDAKDAFWAENPDDRLYESKMSEILLEEKEKYGADAAWQLAQNLPRLLREAKFASGAFDSDAARDAGRREEREALRKSQEGASDSAHATTQTSPSTKVNQEWIENTYDSSNPEHRKMLDDAIARGDFY